MVYQKTRFHVFQRDKFTCQYCGRSSPEVVLEVDHVVPVSKGGNNDFDNLITSCRECNKQKSNHEIIENVYAKEETAIPNAECSDINYEPSTITIEFKSNTYNKKIELHPDSALKDVPDITNKERFIYSVLCFAHMSSYSNIDLFFDHTVELCENDFIQKIMGFQPLSFNESDSEEEISDKTKMRYLEIWHKICDMDTDAKSKKDAYERKKVKRV